MKAGLTHERMVQAIKGGSLYELAVAFKKEGMSQGEMLELFDSFRAKHEADEDETTYDAILDTMDFISGWCIPKLAIFKQDGESEQSS